MVRAEHVIDSWKSVRQDTIAAVEEFPAGEFEYRPAADLQTFGQIGRHILVSTHGLTGMLLAGDTDFADPGIRKARIATQVAHIPENLEPAELVRRLRESVDERAIRKRNELARRKKTTYCSCFKNVGALLESRLTSRWPSEPQNSGLLTAESAISV